MHRLLPLLLLIAVSGCATIFSGSSQRVSIRATPEDSTIIVLGGATGAAMAKIGKVAYIQRRMLELLSPALSAADREFIAAVGIERFLTSLILEMKTGRMPSDTTQQLAEVFARIPRPLKEKIMGTLGLEAFGVGKLDVVLDRGEIYAVIGWRTGSDLEIRSIDGSFNWATLWNILNLGIGVPIDLYTGAWLKLAPAKLVLELEPIPQAP